MVNSPDGKVEGTSVDFRLSNLWNNSSAGVWDGLSGVAVTRVAGAACVGKGHEMVAEVVKTGVMRVVVMIEDGTGIVMEVVVVVSARSSE